MIYKLILLNINAGFAEKGQPLSFTERVVVINGERRVIAEALVFIYRAVPGALAEFGADLQSSRQPTFLAQAWLAVRPPRVAGVGGVGWSWR